MNTYYWTRNTEQGSEKEEGIENKDLRFVILDLLENIELWTPNKEQGRKK